MKIRTISASAEAKQFAGDLLPGMERRDVKDSLGYWGKKAGVVTPRGFTVVEPGDWVVQFEGGGVLVLDNATFRLMWEEQP